MKALELARLNLVRRRTSTLIAIFAIALSVTMGAMIYRIFHLGNQRFTTLAGGGTSIVGPKGGGVEILLNALNAEGEFPGFVPYALYTTLDSETNLPFQDGSVANTSGTKLIVPMLYAAKFGENRVLSTNGKFLERPYGDDSAIVSEGRWFEDPGEIVVGSQVAKTQGLSIGQEIKVSGWSEQGTTSPNFSFKVVGILRESKKIWDQLLFNSIEDGQAIIESNPGALKSSIWGSKVLSYFWVFQDGNSAKAMNELINKRSIAQFVSVYDQKQKLREWTGTGEDLGLTIMAFIVLLGILSVTAIMITRFDSMHLQIAVLRAIGYQQSAVSKWLILEGFLLGSVAVLLGICLEWALFPFVASLLGKSLPPSHGGWSDFLLPYPVWGAALISTVVATVIPLYRLYRQDVHSSLKTV